MVPLMVLALATTGCVAALVGGAFYYKAKGKEEKKDFLEQYNKTNIERHKAGLPPLDLCTEKYHFDEGWAKNDPACKARIEEYEAGNKGALGVPQLYEETNKQKQGGGQR
jgi:hypothetical protein